MIICLIRHGQTNWNKRHLVQGLTDNHLNEIGLEQARNVGEYLKQNDPNWDVFVSSPLIRAQETAQVIKEILNFPKEINIYPDIHERDFGSLEGFVLDDHCYDIIEEEKAAGLEKLADLKIRSYQALINLEKLYPNQKVLAFSHAQFIKSLIIQLDPNFNFRNLLKNSSMNYFEVKDGKIKIIKYNISAEK